MGPEFVQRVAPALALKPRNSGKGWTAPQAGVTPPDNMYDAQGTPLNWMQEEGGQRQFFVPEGQQAYTPEQLRGLTPEPSMQIRGTSPVEELPPNAGLTLRGTTPPDIAGAYSRPSPGRFAPSSMAGLTESPQDLLRRESVRGRTSIPPNRELRGNIRTVYGSGPDSQSMRIPQGGAQPNAAALQTAADSQETLGGLLSRFNFNIPQLRLNSAGTGEASAATDLRGRGAADVLPTGNATALNNFEGNGMPMFDTADAISQFNQATGFNILSTQVRTQAQQDSLVSRGLTRSRTSYHTSGQAADIPGSQLNGLTGQAAINEVRNRLQAAGYPVNNMDIVWESGHGRNQGTGPHIHIEPRATRSQ